MIFLLNSCKPHESTQNWLASQNVDIVFIPPNITSKIQPVKAGVIASVKIPHIPAQMTGTTDLTGENFADVYEADMSIAMKMMKNV